jgi:hypothetical protein
MTTYKVGFMQALVGELYPDCWTLLGSMSWKFFGVARPPEVGSMT